MHNEGQRKTVDRQRRQSVSPPSKQQHRAGSQEQHYAANTAPASYSQGSSEKPPWSTQVKRYNPPAVRPPYDPYVSRSKDKDNGAMVCDSYKLLLDPTELCCCAATWG